MRKYKGNTLVEVMIALALTSFAATLAVVIYLNIQKSTVPFFKMKASEIASRYMEETISEKDFFDRSEEEQGFVVRRKVVRHPVFYDCNKITISVFDAEKKKLAELQTTAYAE